MLMQLAETTSQPDQAGQPRATGQQGARGQPKIAAQCHPHPHLLLLQRKVMILMRHMMNTIGMKGVLMILICLHPRPRNLLQCHPVFSMTEGTEHYLQSSDLSSKN